ncbi:MAG TPA: hypothetical protein VGV91_05270 [Rubrobacter sp.]|jgi:hypothetical protein|nr:hypothetical protein [Rubrobacter sp.]
MGELRADAIEAAVSWRVGAKPVPEGRVAATPPGFCLQITIIYCDVCRDGIRR